MSELELRGLDGSNPLGMLAALGVLRVASLADPDARMGWRMEAWPFPAMQTRLTLDALAEAIIEEGRRVARDVASEQYGDVIAVERATFKRLAEAAIPATGLAAAPTDSDYFASWASDAVCEEKSAKVKYCGFSFSNKNGMQFLLLNFRKLTELCDAEAMGRNLATRDAVLSKESVTGLNWDPHSYRAYALRWHNPDDQRNSPKHTNIGLNVLAFIGLSLLTSVPIHGGRLGSTGMVHEANTWIWPIWSDWLPRQVVKSLLAESRFQRETGVLAVYRAERVSMNKRFYFTPAHRLQ